MDDFFGAIIVCGGKSTRMGTSKAMLPFGPETVLQRIVRIVSDAVSGPIVVVAAREQPLPALPSRVEIMYDEHDALGPLEGLRVGLNAFRSRLGGNGAACPIALAVSCDVPLLQREFMIRLETSLTPEFDAVVARSAGFLHPLAAAYRIDTVLPHVERLVATRKLKLTSLFNDIRTRVLDEDELRTIDPNLVSLRNMNTPEEYEALLGLAGFQQWTTDNGPRTNQ